MTAMSCDLSNSIRGMFPADGKKDFLASVHRSGRCDGLALAVIVVEPGAHIASVGALLVGRLSQRMVELNWLDWTFRTLCREAAENDGADDRT
jgi:hypothetical protein